LKRSPHDFLDLIGVSGRVTDKATKPPHDLCRIEEEAPLLEAVSPVRVIHEFIEVLDHHLHLPILIVMLLIALILAMVHPVASHNRVGYPRTLSAHRCQDDPFRQQIGIGRHVIQSLGELGTTAKCYGWAHCP